MENSRAALPENAEYRPSSHCAPDRLLTKFSDMFDNNFTENANFRQIFEGGMSNWIHIMFPQSPFL